MLPVEEAETLYRVVNLEKGMPPAQEAVEHLKKELQLARTQRVKVLTLIHGYGSSGKGGKIKKEVRRQLQHLLYQSEIKDVICGEDLGKKAGKGKQLLRRFPMLNEHRDIQRANPGITLVLL